MGSIIGGIITTIASLFWFILGGYVFKLSLDEQCSCWWPRALGILWLLQGLSLSLGALMIFIKKEKPTEQKVKKI